MTITHTESRNKTIHSLLCGTDFPSTCCAELPSLLRHTILTNRKTQHHIHIFVLCTKLYHGKTVVFAIHHTTNDERTKIYLRNKQLSHFLSCLPAPLPHNISLFSSSSSEVRLLHEDELLDEAHVVGLALAEDGAHAGDLLRLVVVVVQVAPVVVSLRLLREREEGGMCDQGK